MSISTFISTNASILFINSDSNYTFILPTANNYTNRMIYIKQYLASSFSQSYSLSPSISDTIETNSLGAPLTFSSASAVILQSAGGNPGKWSFHSQYKWVNTMFSNSVPQGIPVYPSTGTMNKNIFLNLTGSSKTVVLPPANSWTTTGYGVPIITIKDINSNAFNNPFYISTSGSDILEHSSLKGCFKITSSLAAIELVANPTALANDFTTISSCWSILTYYNGISNI